MEAVIFDLDGVLVSTDEMHYQAWKRLGESIGITGFTRDDNKRQRGVSRMESLEVLLEHSDRAYSAAEKQALASRKNGYYIQMLEGLTPGDILPGAKDTLERLKDMGIKTALGSSSKNSTVILKKTGLYDYFDAVADGNDITRSKPDPEVFLTAARKLGADAGQCLVVEDAPSGIAAAHAAGMKALAVGAAVVDTPAEWHATGLDDASIDWEKLLRD